jgi:hypothetical protein
LNAGAPLLGLFTIPAEYFSCFCAGTATGDNGVLDSSAECFADPFPLPYKMYIFSLLFNVIRQMSMVKTGAMFTVL